MFGPSRSQVAAARIPFSHRLWSHRGLLFAVAVAAIFAGGLAALMHRLPYPISETIAILEDLEDHSGAARDAFDLASPFFRPAFWGTLELIWAVDSSVEARMALYTHLHVAVVAVVLLLLVVALRPRTLPDGAAATLALAVVVGSPSFRDNLENLPLNQMMVLTALALVTWLLLEAPGRRHGWLALCLAAVGLGFKEEGLVLIAVIATGAYLGAPGASRTVGVVATACGAAYVLVRLIGSDSWPLFMQDVGFGFTVLGVDEAEALFGTNPFGIYAYNVAATASNVLFSEPTSGVFSITRSLRDGELRFWQINHVLSSVGTTAMIAWWGRGAWRAGGASRRLIAVMLVALAVSSALGFKYTRDRFGGLALVFYAVAAYHASGALLRRGHMRRLATGVVTTLVVLTALGWQLRAVGTLHHLRVTTDRNRLEWLVDWGERQQRFQDRPTYLHLMDQLRDQGTRARHLETATDARWLTRVLGD